MAAWLRVHAREHAKVRRRHDLVGVHHHPTRQHVERQQDGRKQMRRRDLGAARLHADLGARRAVGEVVIFDQRNFRHRYSVWVRVGGLDEVASDSARAGFGVGLDSLDEPLAVNAAGRLLGKFSRIFFADFFIEPHADPTRHRSNAMGPAGVCAHTDVRVCGSRLGIFRNPPPRGRNGTELRSGV
eukprot:5697229-Prymnesium_polylepis.1